MVYQIFYLFYKAKLIPKFISIYGIAVYSLTFIYAFFKILTPQSDNLLVMDSNIDMLFFMPGVIFEILIGIWLLIKGVNLKDYHTLVSS